MSRAVLGLLLCLFGLFAPRPAQAVTTVVIVVQGREGADPAPVELRLRSELIAEGFATVVANPGEPPSIVELELLAARLGADAAMMVSVSPTGLSGTVWVREPKLELDVVRNLEMPNQGQESTAVFCLRAVDVLRGTLLELEQQWLHRGSPPATTEPPPPAQPEPPPLAPAPTPKSSAAPSQPPPTPVPAPAAPPDEPWPTRSDEPAEPEPPKPIDPARLRLAVALAGHLTDERVGSGFAPALSARLGMGQGWALGLLVAGPWLDSIRSLEGSAQVDQQAALLRGGRYFRFFGDWEVEAVLGLGVARYSARGSPADTYVGRRQTAWSFAATAGAQGSRRITGRFWAFLEIDGLLRLPAPHVAFDGRNVSGNSSFSALGLLGLAAFL